MPIKLRVCAEDSIGEGEMREFAIPGVSHPILVGRVHGNIFATNGICPHEDVNLIDGRLDCQRQNPSVICPGHAYIFDVQTGASTHDPELNLPVYRVSILDGWVHVELISALSQAQ